MIESAPATMPSTTAITLVAAFAAGTVNRSPSSRASPARSASPATGTSPADDTRFGSSNSTDNFQRS